MEFFAALETRISDMKASICSAIFKLKKVVTIGSKTALLLSMLGGFLLFGNDCISRPDPAKSTITYETVEVSAPFEMPAIKIPVSPEMDFEITDFGADADSKSKTTEAIENAIQACHEAGGGRVVIPTGEWLTGAVHLKSNVNLHLEKDAVLRLSDDPDDYLPAVHSTWEGWECYNYSPLIYAFECENVAITGEGMLIANMELWEKWSSRPPAHMDALKKLYFMGSKGVPTSERQMAEGENHFRPQFIQFNRCKHILIEDISIRNSPFWTIHLYLCDSGVVRGVNIKANGHNNDGIDPEGTRNLLIEDCYFDQGDDAIAIKSGRNQDGWRLNRPSENIVMRNCTMVAGHQLCAIGSELSGGVRNVYIHDCQFIPRNPDARIFNLLYIKTNRRRGGFVENITMENIDAKSANFTMGVFGIETDVLYQWRHLVPTIEERPTPIEGITVRNVLVNQTSTPFRILGDKDLPVLDVEIDNVKIGTVRGQRTRFEHVENLNLKNVEIAHFIEESDKENKNR